MPLTVHRFVSAGDRFLYKLASGTLVSLLPGFGVSYIVRILLMNPLPCAGVASPGPVVHLLYMC